MAKNYLPTQCLNKNNYFLSFSLMSSKYRPEINHKMASLSTTMISKLSFHKKHYAKDSSDNRNDKKLQIRYNT